MYFHLCCPSELMFGLMMLKKKEADIKKSVICFTFRGRSVDSKLRNTPTT